MGSYNTPLIGSAGRTRPSADESWATITGSAGTDANHSSSTRVCFFWSLNTPNKWLRNYRFKMVVDTTGLVGSVSAATFTLSGISKWDNIVCTPSICLVGSGGATNDIVASDYQTIGSTLYAAAVPWASIGTSIVFTLNAAGLAAINAGGYTMFGLKWLPDVNGADPYNVPYKDTGITFPVPGGAGTLTTTESTLAVQTDPATNISANNAQLNGTLLDDNSNPPINVHFDAGTTSACSDWSGGAHSVNESESFAATIVDLTPGVTYYFRAVAVDGATTVYGAVLSFTVAQGPTRPLTRVSAIKHIFQAGEEGRPGIYRMQLILGGLSAGWFPTFTGVQPTAPPPDSAVSGDWTTLNLSKSMDGQQLLAQYGRWLSERTPAQIKAIFGHPPTFDEWRQWYVVYGTGAF
jgi:hypothetical protein